MKNVAKALIASAAAFESGVSYNDYASSAGITCGGTITSDQTIVSPTNGGFYYADTSCIWEVELDASVASFDLVAKSFAVETSGDCRFDFLRIVDGAGYEVNYCGFTDPSTLRRKRDAELEKERASLSGRTVVNPITTGLKKHTVIGNTATITFQTDFVSHYKGFEIDIVAGGATEEPAAPSPADAWAQIEAAAADIAIRVDDFYDALPGLGVNSVLASKKVARFNAFFAKMQKLNSFSSADPCTYPAGSNDHTTFVAPVDSADACEELNGLFASLVSFTDSFVCMPNAEYKPAKLNALIHRQRRQIVTRKLKQMKCGN
ncbi:Oidioi.mRNA.OKI2018_I69.chr1.g1550.t1.cds [Oikopleura dioica]|uniref:Oidioi.mRNA.OKI2018_I69.chr1.g1550.t1.cds n=1 Tax=Oikopleura dioica TaxID=34765 RepID=A0ABN7SRT6_OIKDI|nr:Oidioi.mRNA.OKI2018_I69.chr1.g1550.t1.cds [Oikopleura dioica]